jgi:hypothetical protein
LKENLVRNKDYKMANEYVWNFFYGIYGGGPLIIRSEKDIYSKKAVDYSMSSPDSRYNRVESPIERVRYIREKSIEKVRNGVDPKLKNKKCPSNGRVNQILKDNKHFNDESIQLKDLRRNKMVSNSNMDL